jgi:hypothetical protein
MFIPLLLKRLCNPGARIVSEEYFHVKTNTHIQLGLRSWEVTYEKRGGAKAFEVNVISLFASYHAPVWPENAAISRFWEISVGRTSENAKKSEKNQIF